MQVWYMSGAGNDFMVVDARNMQPDFAQLAVALCARTHADGFMALAQSPDADFRLHFYNSDGSRGEMCGNGSRCVCRFAYDNGIAPANMTMQTDAGLVRGERICEDRYRVQLTNPEQTRMDALAGVDYTVVGVPHALVRVEGLTFSLSDALLPRARALRHDAAFPKGANVDFYDLIDASHARVLTFERGVEDYTLACGTGCASVATILWKKGLLPGGELTCENKGGTLRVRILGENGVARAVFLEGDATLHKIYEL